ncbi:cyclic nucleotide-binding/CBS domain-containing protein [Candidatus Nitrososphaera sp. FF02]|uniref:CBS domain-containing protein n=1 Tax=Candidatus Nitrososphaera sp. FF02 TaxID=3398226 RepID=UPI002FA3C62D
MVKKPVREHADPHMTTRVIVRDIMNSPVITASPSDSLRDVAKKMKSENVGSIVVMDKNEPAGLVTDFDIVTQGVAKDSKPSAVKAKDVMRDLHTIESQESITEAARLLRKHGIKRLGVVYKNRLVGIISASDVIAVTPDLVDVVSEKAAIIRGELGRPAGKVSGYCDECSEWSDLLQYDEGTFICEVCRGEAAPVAE